MQGSVGRQQVLLVRQVTRSYYFSSLKPAQRNTEFPLNIGYNDFFQHYAMYKGTRSEQLKLRMR